ncbi:MAG: hypothetical protein VX252_14005, partial [Myxococcota bacterium]|nr:hypothetical protein [Myxococcota bacterium]
WARWRSVLLLLGVTGSILVSGSESEALSTETRSGPVDVKVDLSPEEPVMGDPLTLKVEVTADRNVEVLMPEFGEALDRFRIVNFFPREEINSEGRTVLTQNYTLQAPVSGPHTIPAILIEFVDMRTGQSPAPDGQDAYEILTEGIPFEVASVMPESTVTELHPPLGRLEKPDAGKNNILAWVMGLLVGLGLLAIWAWYSWKRDLTTSAWENAQEELEALLLAPRPPSEDIGPFFVALSDIIRRYLENRFSLRSPELTTERFLELVSDSPDLSRKHQSLLRNFLSQCDLVKFAGHIPTSEAIEEAIHAARLFLDETRETAEPQTLGTPEPGSQGIEASES